MEKLLSEQELKDYSSGDIEVTSEVLSQLSRESLQELLHRCCQSYEKGNHSQSKNIVRLFEELCKDKGIYESYCDIKNEDGNDIADIFLAHVDQNVFNKYSDVISVIMEEDDVRDKTEWRTFDDELKRYLFDVALKEESGVENLLSSIGFDDYPFYYFQLTLPECSREKSLEWILDRMSANNTDEDIRENKDKLIDYLIYVDIPQQTNLNRIFNLFPSSLQEDPLFNEGYLRNNNLSQQESVVAWYKDNLFLPSGCIWDRLRINDKARIARVIILNEEKAYHALSDIKRVPYYYSLPDFLEYKQSSQLQALESLTKKDLGLPEVIFNQIKYTRGMVKYIMKNTQPYSHYQRIHNGELLQQEKEIFTALSRILKGTEGDYELELPLVVLDNSEFPDNNTEDKYEIDRLGEYRCKTRTVVLFYKRIEEAAENMNCDPSDLQAIVFAHEIGHYIFFAHPFKDSNTYPMQLYNKTLSELYEIYAQLFAAWASDGIDWAEKTFNNLVAHQNGIYLSFQHFVNKNKTAIINLISRFRKGEDLYNWQNELNKIP